MMDARKLVSVRFGPWGQKENLTQRPEKPWWVDRFRAMSLGGRHFFLECFRWLKT